MILRPKDLNPKDTSLGIIRYIDDHSVSVLKSTRLDRNKRSATRSKTAISIPHSVVSTELKAMVSTEESASHKGEIFVQETEATICDHRGALELWSRNGYALSEMKDFHVY